MTEMVYDPTELCVSRDCTIQQVLEILNRTAKGLVLHLDERGVLLQTITDGDVRRMLIAGHQISEKLETAAIRQPITAPERTPAVEALAIMDRHLVDQLPLINEDGTPTGLFLRRDLADRIYLSTPHMGDEEIRYVNEAFETNWVAPLGPNVDAFERELADVVGVKHAAALNSGTAAIHLALILLGVGSGDRVFCSSLTFVASANPILYCNAEPVFIDSDAASWNMSPEALERALEQAKRENQMPKAVVIVDIYGQAADYDSILPICERYGVPIVEDAAEALGASYSGRTCGSFGTIGIFSFNGNKIITTSGGGMLVAEDPDFVTRARKLATQAREDAPHYEHVEIGFNYRMSNVLAGIGRGQLAQLGQRVMARRAVFDHYRDRLKNIDAITWMPEIDGSHSNRWLTTCALAESIDPLKVITEMARVDIEARRVWKPMHLQPLFHDAQYITAGNHDVSAELFAQGLCLPSGSNMTHQQIDRVCDAFEIAIARAHSGTLVR